MEWRGFDADGRIGRVGLCEFGGDEVGGIGTRREVDSELLSSGAMTDADSFWMLIFFFSQMEERRWSIDY